ncbi:MAG: hypothetical protein NTY02_12470 [Acidobacteria bacterium]|nr:hypothetical protein [Acidobacteriota bacterium]
MAPTDRTGARPSSRPSSQGSGRPATSPAPVAGPLAQASDRPAYTSPLALPADAPVSPVVTPEISAVARMLQRKVPYLKFAFANPYNLSLLIGAVAASVLTMNPLIALVALGGEAIWLLHAPGSERLRHLLWDPRFAELKTVYETQQRAARMQLLSSADRQRVDRLVALKKDMERLANQNPSFTTELLNAELVKTDRLVESFLDMAVTCARYEHYLDSVDLTALDRDRDRWDRAIRDGAADTPQVDIAKKNLAVIMKRFEKVQEIRRYLTVARGQLDLIENSFRLLADQIVTMQSPQELSGQLDELLTGVEAIKQSSADTERLLASMGLSNNA